MWGCLNVVYYSTSDIYELIYYFIVKLCGGFLQTFYEFAAEKTTLLYKIC